MTRILALLMGAAFIAAGVAGYGAIPQLLNNGLLLGYFEIDAVHSLVYLVTGVLAVISAGSATLSKLFFIVAGLAYGTAALLGYWRHGDLFYMYVSQTDNYLFAGVAVFALLIGLSAERK